MFFVAFLCCAYHWAYSRGANENT